MSKKRTPKKPIGIWPFEISTTAFAHESKISCPFCQHLRGYPFKAIKEVKIKNPNTTGALAALIVASEYMRLEVKERCMNNDGHVVDNVLLCAQSDIDRAIEGLYYVEKEGTKR